MLCGLKPFFRCTLELISSIVNRIPGIYSYCNRWCERCPLGHRCVLHPTQNREDPLQQLAADLPDFSGEEDHPPRNFDWDQAQELEAELEAREAQAPFDFQRHPLQKTLHVWTQLYHDLWRALAADDQQLQEQAFLHEVSAQRMDNALSVLKHYIFFIEPKLVRALGGLHDGAGLESSPQNDANGTAKLILISLRQVQGATMQLLPLKPVLEIDLQRFIQAGEELREGILKFFPHALDFVRPGFDTIGVQEDLGV